MLVRQVKAVWLKKHKNVPNISKSDLRPRMQLAVTALHTGTGGYISARAANAGKQNSRCFHQQDVL